MNAAKRSDMSKFNHVYQHLMNSKLTDNYLNWISLPPLPRWTPVPGDMATGNFSLDQHANASSATMSDLPVVYRIFPRNLSQAMQPIESTRAYFRGARYTFMWTRRSRFMFYNLSGATFSAWLGDLVLLKFAALEIGICATDIICFDFEFDIISDIRHVRACICVTQPNCIPHFISHILLGSEKYVHK